MKAQFEVSPGAWLWRGAAILALCTSAPAHAANLTISTGGRVSIELLYTEAEFHNTMSIMMPSVAVVASGCDIEASTGLPGVAIVSQKTSQVGCRVDLDADPVTSGVQGFAANTTFEFRLCAQKDTDAQCEHVWSSNPANNSPSESYDHLRTTNPSSGIYVLGWEDIAGGGDEDFDDLVVILRIAQDTDGDGLWDDWETTGIDTDGNGTPDLTLPGANPMHKDIYVEIDWMDCTVAGSDCGASDTHNHQPDNRALVAVQNAFAAAPVNNPDGIQGINVRFASSNSLAHETNVDLGCIVRNSTQFDDIKSDPANFGPLNARRFAYHYMIFGHAQATTDLGSSGCGEQPGNDLIITLGSVGNGNVQQQATTIMHELGHNLNLDHGGGDGTNFKPNYLSIMSYSFQFNGVGPDPDGSGPLTQLIDFSRAALNPLDETSLSEAAGIGDGANGTRFFCPGATTQTMAASNGAINWNCSGTATETVAVNINGDTSMGSPVLGTLNGFDDWPALKYDFQNSGSFRDGEHPQFTQQIDVSVIAGSPPTADAGPVADGNPNTPVSAGIETYNARLGDTVTLNGSGSFDTNGNVVDYAWDFPDGAPVDATGPSPGFVCTSFVGNVVLSLTVTDNDGLKASDPSTVDIAVDAGPDQTIECTGQNSAQTTLGVYDPGAATTLVFVWRDENGQVISTQPQPTVAVTLGTHAYTLTVTDSRSVARSDEVLVTVQDTQPPVVVVSTNPVVLWPPNHDHQRIDVTRSIVSVSDECDPSVGIASVSVDSVTSDEPENAAGNGDGNTTEDIQIVCPNAVRLRAERSGSLNGRVYTIYYSVEDGSGNKTQAPFRVSVPQDNSGAPALLDPGATYTVSTACRLQGSQRDGFGNRQGGITVSRLGRGQIRIAFALQSAGPVELRIYDVLGRLVQSAKQDLSAGPNRILWDGTGSHGRIAPSGVYLFQVRKADGVLSAKGVWIH